MCLNRSAPTCGASLGWGSGKTLWGFGMARNGDTGHAEEPSGRREIQADHRVSTAFDVVDESPTKHVTGRKEIKKRYVNMKTKTKKPKRRKQKKG